MYLKILNASLLKIEIFSAEDRFSNNPTRSEPTEAMVCG